MRVFFSCGNAFGGGKYCGVAAMLKISASCFRATVYLLPIVVSGIVGVGLSNACVKSAASCVDVYYE